MKLSFIQRKKSPHDKDFKNETSSEAYETTVNLKYSIVFLYFLRLTLILTATEKVQRDGNVSSKRASPRQHRNRPHRRGYE
jgi:hypothetical protein